MIDRKMSRSDFTAEIFARVVRRIDVVTASADEVNATINAVAVEIADEIRAQYADLELDIRRLHGERVN